MGLRFEQTQAAAFFRETLSGERPLDELAAALSTRKFDANLIFATKSTPLHMAAALGSAAGAALLLKRGADSLLSDGANRSALANACAHGRAAVAQLILDDLKPKHAGVLMSMADDKGWTELHHAALGGSVRVVELLVRKGLVDALRSRPPAASGSQTPLHLAAAKVDAAMCAAVCAQLPELVSASCAEGKRGALMLASQRHFEAVGALLAARADVHARDDEVGRRCTGRLPWSTRARAPRCSRPGQTVRAGATRASRYRPSRRCRRSPRLRAALRRDRSCSNRVAGVRLQRGRMFISCCRSNALLRTPIMLL